MDKATFESLKAIEHQIVRSTKLLLRTAQKETDSDVHMALAALMLSAVTLANRCDISRKDLEELLEILWKDYVMWREAGERLQ
jgi:hypothetical protein